MKGKVFILILVLLLILLAVNTFKLQNEVNRQHKITEQQTKAIDSLLLIIEAKQAEEKHMREKAQQIIASNQEKADSLRRVSRKN